MEVSELPLGIKGVFSRFFFLGFVLVSCTKVYAMGVMQGYVF